MNGELLTVHEEYLNRLDERSERYRNQRDALVKTLEEIHVMAADAQLRASYQRTALELISAKAQSALSQGEGK